MNIRIIKSNLFKFSIYCLLQLAYFKDLVINSDEQCIDKRNNLIMAKSNSPSKN